MGARMSFFSRGGHIHFIFSVAVRFFLDEVDDLFLVVVLKIPAKTTKWTILRLSNSRPPRKKYEKL